MREAPRKVAIVTGAGSGVGREAALLLADAGYAVVLAARTEATLKKTAQAIHSQVRDAPPTLVCPADVSSSAAVDALVQKTLDAFGRIDAVANCAGSAPLLPIDQLSDALIDDTVAVNLKSVIYMTRAVWPTFVEQNSGAICNVSSMASLDPFTGFSVYGAAKAGVNTFTKATADEGAALNVIAAAVAPGAVETPMLRENFSAEVFPTSKTLSPRAVAEVVRDVLTGDRPVTPGQTIVLPSPD